MIQGFKDDKRRVIPIWRDYRTTLRLGELGYKKNVLVHHDDTPSFLKKAIYEWNGNKDLPYAAELVSSAIVAREYLVAKEAANFILVNAPNEYQFIKTLAKKILSINEDFVSDVTNPKELACRRISYLRKVLYNEPRNSIALADISREYIILGECVKAKKSMELALKIESDNRYLLRSASRLFFHLGDYGRSHDILRKSEIIKYDPWVLASEIAIASILNRSSIHIKQAKAILSSDSFDYFHVSELASALATINIENGDYRDAKHNLSISVQKPNDNSAAQIIWLSRIQQNKSIMENASKYINVPCAYEALALSSYVEKDFKQTIIETIKWINDQPFSSRPVTFGSFIAASCLEDFTKAEEITKIGLEMNPNDKLLLNNLTFALINLGKLDEALICFKKIKDLEKDNERIMWNATYGLLLFRTGNFESGRQYYDKAINIADKYSDLYDYKAQASIYLAKEELLAGSDEAKPAFELASKYANNSNSIATQQILSNVNDLFIKKGILSSNSL